MNFKITKDQEFLKAAEQYVKDISSVNAEKYLLKTDEAKTQEEIENIKTKMRKEYVGYFTNNFNTCFDSTISDIRKNLGHFFMDTIMEGTDIPYFKEELTAEPWDILSHLDNPTAKEAVLNMMHGHLKDAVKAREEFAKKQQQDRKKFSNPFANKAKRSAVNTKEKTKFINVESSKFGKLNMIFRKGVLYFSATDLARILHLPTEKIEKAVKCPVDHCDAWPSKCIEEGQAIIDIIGMVFMLQDAINEGLSESASSEFMTWMVESVIPQAYALENIKDTMKDSLDYAIEDLFRDFSVFDHLIW